MGHLGPRRSLPEIPTHADIAPVIQHRAMSSMPECGTVRQNDEWMMKTLCEDLTFLIQTGSEKDIQRSPAAIALLREMNHTKGRAGRPAALISTGGPMVCVDYSSQTVSVGDLSWTSIDIGENLPIGGNAHGALRSGKE